MNIQNQDRYQHVAKVVINSDLFPNTILFRGDLGLIAQEVVRIVCRDIKPSVTLLPVHMDVDVPRIVWDAEHNAYSIPGIEYCSSTWKLQKQIPHILAWLEEFLNDRGVALLVRD